MATETANHISEFDTSKPGNEDAGLINDYLVQIKTVLKTDFGGINKAVTATADELNTLDGITASTAELNILDGVTATAAQLNAAAASAVAPLTFSAKSADFTAEAGYHYLCSGSGAINMTLPAAPNANDRVRVSGHGSYVTVTAVRNGKKILGQDANVVVATLGSGVTAGCTLEFTGDTFGWAIY